MRYTLMVAAFLCVTAAPISAAAQARVEALDPDASSFRVERLGSFIAETADIGMELLPGDLLTSSASGTALELNCPAGSNNSYRLEGPFRVLIDAPREEVCHVNLMGGSVDVLSESGTSVTAGGVEMGSVSTQYAVRLEGSGAAVTPKLIVFDGKVAVSTVRGRTLELTQGLAVPLNRAGPISRPQAVASEEFERSAAIYTTLNIAKASRAGAQIGDRSAVMTRLTTLHSAVLKNPADTAKRAELAKYQIQYQINNEALYNLKRVDLTNEQKLQRYDIDPGTLQRGLTKTNRDFYIARVRPDVTRAVAVPTTDTDLELIAAGKVDEALKSLLARVEAGNATSRDYFALSKAYFELKDVKRSAAYGERALKLNAEDRKLSEIEQREQRAILARIRG